MTSRPQFKIGDTIWVRGTVSEVDDQDPAMPFAVTFDAPDGYGTEQAWAWIEAIAADKPKADVVQFDGPPPDDDTLAARIKKILQDHADDIPAEPTPKTPPPEGVPGWIPEAFYEVAQQAAENGWTLLRVGERALAGDRGFYGHARDAGSCIGHSANEPGLPGWPVAVAARDWVCGEADAAGSQLLVWRNDEARAAAAERQRAQAAERAAARADLPDWCPDGYQDAIAQAREAGWALLADGEQSREGDRGYWAYDNADEANDCIGHRTAGQPGWEIYDGSYTAGMPEPDDGDRARLLLWRHE